MKMFQYRERMKYTVNNWSRFNIYLYHQKIRKK